MTPSHRIKLIKHDDTTCRHTSMLVSNGTVGDTNIAFNPASVLLTTRWTFPEPRSSSLRRKLYTTSFSGEDLYNRNIEDVIMKNYSFPRKPQCVRPPLRSHCCYYSASPPRTPVRFVPRTSMKTVEKIDPICCKETSSHTSIERSGASETTSQASEIALQIDEIEQCEHETDSSSVTSVINPQSNMGYNNQVSKYKDNDHDGQSVDSASVVNTGMSIDTSVQYDLEGEHVELQTIDTGKSVMDIGIQVEKSGKSVDTAVDSIVRCGDTSPFMKQQLSRMRCINALCSRHVRRASTHLARVSALQHTARALLEPLPENDHLIALLSKQ